MEYLVIPGDAAYTDSAARKIKDLINKSGGVKVEEVKAIWVHYAELHQVHGDSVKVIILFISTISAAQLHFFNFLS